MPLYEYQCPKCGNFELIQKFSDEPLAKCPTCGSPVQKLLSAPAIQFKGTGWYITDYARKSDAKDGKKGKTEGGEAKPADKGDSGSKDGSKDSSTSTTAKTGTGGTTSK